MKTKIISIIASCILLVGCNVNTNEIQTNCGKSIEDLKKLNTISEECKKAIKDLLPGFQSNLNNNLVKTGISLSSTLDTIYFSTSNINGDPESVDTSSVKINSWKQGVEKDITSDVTWLKQNLKYSLSIVVDYSGSMSVGDIKDAYSILNDFLNIEQFINGCEANHIIFSDSVTEKSKYVSGIEKLRSVLKIDTSYNRSSTSLYDAMGFGLESLSERARPAKILVVFTDGQENSSKKYTVEQIINSANINNITIILIGSLFSDLDAFKNISTKTKGIYLYNKNIADLKDPLVKAGKIMTGSNSFKVAGNLAGDSLVVAYKGQSIGFKIK
jgi:hypothetical protein